MNKKMRNAYITIGSKCNHRCTFCPCKWNSPRSEMSEDVLIDRIKEMANISLVDKITISGGEPTVHDSFLTVMKYLSTLTPRIELLTNADRLSDKSLVDRITEIVPAEKMHVTTAIHSINPAIHDYITGSKGSLFRSLKGMHYMIDAGYQYSVKICISRLNYMGIPELIRFLYQDFPESVNIIFCNIDYSGYSSDQFNSVKVKFREIRPYLECSLSFIDQQEQNGVHRNIVITNMPLCCLDSKYWKYVINDSKMDTAAFLPYLGGDARDISEPLYNVKSRSGTFGIVCRNCEVEPYCPGVWSSAIEVLGEDDLKPIKIIKK